MSLFFNRLIDRLQAMFPPNRVVVLCGGLITALSGSLAAWLAAHFPGLNLGAPEIAGVMAAALLISIRLLDRWIDQWQRGEPIDFGGDIEAALAEGGEELLASRDALTGVGQELADLRNRVTAGTINDQQTSHQLGLLGDAIRQFLHDHEPEELEEPAS